MEQCGKEAGAGVRLRCLARVCGEANEKLAETMTGKPFWYVK